MSASGDTVDTLLSVVIITVLLLTSVAVVSTLVEDEAGLPSQVTREAVLLDGAGNTVGIDDGRGTEETLYKSTGYAVELTGADDSYVQSSSPFEVATDGNWTASVWGRVDPGAGSDTMTALSLDGRVLVTFNGTAGNWSAWYYEEGDRDSWQVNVSTSGTEVGNYTNIQVAANGTHLTIYRNATQGEVANITTSNVASAPVNATNWDGRLEEVRTFDEVLNTSKRSELVNAPIEQQPDVNRTARIMFDQPDRDRQIILFADADLDQSNVTFASGFDAVELTAQTDYDWDIEGPKVTPLAGGVVATAPVLYADYGFDTALSSVLDGFLAAMDLASIIPVVLMLVLLVGVMQRYRGR